MARFTCFRTWGNGPAGTYLARSLTRAIAGSLLADTHNMAVANVACTVAQLKTEDATGETPELNADGTAKEDELVAIEESVNSALAIELLQRRTQGRRASRAEWVASRSDVLNVADAELTGTLNLLLNGTIVSVATRVRIQTAG